jgi:hypothetical protein
MPRKPADIQLGLSLVVAALLGCASRDEPPERRCADAQGRLVDDALCGVDGGATGGWGDAPVDGGTPYAHAIPYGPMGYHYVYVPRSYYGGGASSSWGSHSSAAVSRGGFGGTGAAHAATAGS